MMPMPQMQQLHMQAVTQQQVPNQSQPPPQAQQQPPSQAQQTSQTPHLQQNQQFLSAHAQPDHNQRNGMKQREPSLFNSYVYDFLKRSGAHETARTYLREGESLIKLKNDGANPISGGNSSSDNDVNGPLPEADVPVQAPEGFLYEWWSVFWDIYSVKLGRPGSMDAQRYVAERRGNRMISQIPTMNAYQQHPQVVAQAAAAQQHQQQQMRIMQQIPQHPPQQAQQASQQTVQQQQQQQAPSQPSQPPQQPQQTPQQPQPQPSPVNHQSQPFNNRQLPNGVIDANSTNGDMLVTSPQRQQNPSLKMPQRRPPMNMQQLQVPANARQQAMLLHQQHQALQNTAQAQAQAAQSQAQSSQPIQSQGQQQNLNQGQVQQPTASQVQHMTPNQSQAQLNPATKRGVEAQNINQNISMQDTSPNKRQKMDNSAIAGQRQQQQPYQQPGQMAMNQSMMLTTPISNDIASPDLKNRPPHLSGVKKTNPQLQQIVRPQQMPINKPHVNQQIPMVQNTIAAAAHDNELMNQINKQINNASQSMQTISSLIPMSMNHQNVVAASRLSHQNYVNMMINNNRNKIHPNTAMLHLAEKQRNIHELAPMGGRPIPGQQLYMLPTAAQAHQMQTAVPDVGPNNNSAQQMRKNEVKGAKNGKTTPTQSQPQIPNGNISTPQQQQLVIGTNEVQTQSQQPTQTPSALQDGGSLEMNLDEVYNFTVDTDFNFDAYLNFEINDELGSNSNAGPSNGN